MVHACGTRTPSREEVQQLMAKQVSATSEAKLSDNTGKLNAFIRYFFIPTATMTSLSPNNVQANHAYLNKVFQDDIVQGTELNSSKHYPYKPFRGNANIMFSPATASLTTVTATTRKNFTSLNDVKRYLLDHGVKFTPGYIHVVFTTYATDTSDSASKILGVTENLVSQFMVVDPSTVGSPTSPNTSGVSPDHNLGKTLIHEMGHAFGLMHPFLSGSCDGPTAPLVDSQYSDHSVIRQKQPNYHTDLSAVPSTDQGLDNRSRDYFRFAAGDTADNICKGLTPEDLAALKIATTCKQTQIGVLKDLNNAIARYSCNATNAELKLVDTPYEMFMNFMDYSYDKDLIMFTKRNAEIMRANVMKHPNLFAGGNDGSVPSADDDGMGAALIALIVIGSVVALVAAYFGWRQWNAKQGSAGRRKKAEAYFDFVPSTATSVASTATLPSVAAAAAADQ